MADEPVVFNDGEGYERFMGRWSRYVGKEFLDWIKPKEGLDWLEIGCGTGVFTQLLVDRTNPASVVATDPSGEQVAWALRQPVASHAKFSIADAQSLPYSDASFDAVVSALVVHFIPDPEKGLREMRRVCRPGGLVCAYIWDFAGANGPGPMGKALASLGYKMPPIPGLSYTSENNFRNLFVDAGLVEIESKAFEATVEYEDFDDVWKSYTPSFRPETKMIARLSDGELELLKAKVLDLMQQRPAGRLAYSGKAWAVKAKAP